VVYRISPENVRPPRGGPSGALAILVVVGIVVGVWLVAGRDPGAIGGADIPRGTTVVSDAPGRDPESNLPYVAPADLPPPALDVLVSIDTDGATALEGGQPFPNTGAPLPPQRFGYYRQHAVPAGTPVGTAVQLVVSGAEGERYFSDDRGSTFRRIGP